MSLRPLPGRAAILGVATAGVLCAAAAAQLALPGYASSRLADRLRDRLGPVHAAEIAATPAVKLLWGEADRVALHLGDVQPDRDIAGQGRRLLGVDHVDARVDRLTLPAASVDDLHIVKDGDEVRAGFTLPPGALAAGSGGEGMLQRIGEQAEFDAGDDGTLQLALPGGLTGGATLAVSVEDGAIVVAPESGGPLGLVVGTRTIAAPDGLEFDAMTASPDGEGVRVSLQGRATEPA